MSLYSELYSNIICCSRHLFAFSSGLVIRHNWNSARSHNNGWRQTDTECQTFNSVCHAMMLRLVMLSVGACWSVEDNVSQRRRKMPNAIQRKSSGMVHFWTKSCFVTGTFLRKAAFQTSFAVAKNYECACSILSLDCFTWFLKDAPLHSIVLLQRKLLAWIIRFLICWGCHAGNLDTAPRLICLLSFEICLTSLYYNMRIIFICIHVIYC